MRSRRFLFVVVLAALVAGALAAGRASSAPPPARTDATISPSPALVSDPNTVWFCPGLPKALPHAAGRVTFANVANEDAGVVVTDLTDAGAATHASIDVPADSVVTKTRDDLGAPGALTVETFGGRVLVEEGIDGPGALETSPCATETSPHWYFAAGSTPRGVQQWLVIDNPYASDAKVDVTIRTSAGIRKPDALQGLDIARRSRQVISVHDAAVRLDRVSVEVDAEVGAVVAQQAIVYTATAGVPGVALALGSPVSSTDWTFAGGAAFPGSTALVAITNVGDDDAQVDMQATAESTKRTLAPTSLSVPQDAVVWVTLGQCGSAAVKTCISVPDGVRYSLDVRSEQNVAIVAQTVTRFDDAPDVSGAVTSPGSVVPARSWAFARTSVSGERSTTVSLFNPGAESAVVAIALVQNGDALHPPTLRKITVAPGRAVTVVVVGGRHPSKVDGALTIESTQPVYAERSIIGTDEAASAVGIVVGNVGG